MVPVLAMTSLLSTSASPALSLRLDTELTVPSGQGADSATAQLIRFGISDLQRRSLESRDRTIAVRRENQILRRQISGIQELIARMRDFSSLQERTIGVLRSGVAWQQKVRVPAQPAASVSLSLPPPPVTARLQVSEPAPPAATALMVAGVGLPNWLLGGVAGALITAVLAWLLGGVARRRQVVASTTGVAAGDQASNAPTAIEQTDAEVLRELWDENESVGKPAGSQGAGHLSGDSTGPMVEHSPAAADAGGGTLVDDAGAVQAAHTHGAGDEIDWPRTMVSRKAADPQTLKEVDTLIAFEQFDKAKALLDQLLTREPENPEYMLRHYHVRTHGGVDTSADDEDLLRAMMDGPMSDTLLRVREIGRGLMPGDPLFDDNEQREEAVQVLKKARAASDSIEEDVPDFMQTVVLDPADRALRGAQPLAKN